MICMLKKKLKNIANSLPFFIGSKLSFLDYRFRLGSSYVQYKRNASIGASFDLSKFLNILRHAEVNIPFYREYYAAHGFSSSMVNSVNDIKLVPLVDKSILQKYSLSDRSFSQLPGVRSNTGGTSGSPLEFILDSNCYAREWAHMHTIWETLGYTSKSIKLTFRGNNIGSKPLKYFFNQNEFQVNAYAKLDDVFDALDKLLKSQSVQFLHGYPSYIYQFISDLEKLRPELLTSLRSTVKGIFLSSEFPMPYQRVYIENMLNAKTISWYGHSEMAILAFEKNEKYCYENFSSYGMAESVLIDGKHHLVSTSLDNYACPLIRYDTGDIIRPVSEVDGLLCSFMIDEGRVGDFVIDSSGRKITLTGLFFGRHHDAFGYLKFVQVYQSKPGYLDVFLVSDFPLQSLISKFDFHGVDLKFSFHIRSSPVRTRIGKVSILLKDFYEASYSNT